MQLTEDRAGAVVRALVSRGSSIELLHPLGLGGMRPLDHTHALKKVRFFKALSSPSSLSLSLSIYLSFSSLCVAHLRGGCPISRARSLSLLHSLTTCYYSYT